VLLKATAVARLEYEHKGCSFGECRAPRRKCEFVRRFCYNFCQDDVAHVPTSMWPSKSCSPVGTQLVNSWSNDETGRRQWTCSARPSIRE
jgi:hypothetical protein